MLQLRKWTMYGVTTIVAATCLVGLFVSIAHSADKGLAPSVLQVSPERQSILPTATPKATAVTNRTAKPSATAVPREVASARPTATATPRPQGPITVRVADTANLRSGPGTDYEIVGSAAAGTEVVIAGANSAGDWYQLGNGNWIAAFLVEQPSVPVPTLRPTATPQPTPTPNAAATAVMVRRADATATIEARAFTPPDGVWCAQNAERGVCVGAFDYRQSVGYSSAPAGGRLVVLVVQVVNVGNADISANPVDLTLVTADGRSHSYDSATFSLNTPFDYVQIAPGDEALGAIVFVTHADVAPERVIYRGFFEDPVVVDLRKAPIKEK